MGKKKTRKGKCSKVVLLRNVFTKEGVTSCNSRVRQTVLSDSIDIISFPTDRWCFLRPNHSLFC